MTKNKGLNILTHILGYLTTWLGPLIILLITKEKDVKEHAKKALNWQISLTIYAIISGILMIVLIGFLLLIVIGILDLIFCIIAAIKASNNELWDYPLAIPFLK
jgi:uncharacterized Tic20 family protein